VHEQGTGTGVAANVDFADYCPSLRPVSVGAMKMSFST
jgi:hypothetical protein